MKNQLPVYNIHNFRNNFDEKDIYAGFFSTHIKQHPITAVPHKHDFFLVVLFTAGSGIHEIDFTSYKIKPGYVFMMAPGQMHHWTLSKDIDGYVFFHTKDFYDRAFTLSGIMDYPFFKSGHNVPFIALDKKSVGVTENLFKEIVTEYTGTKSLKFEKMHALLSLVYIELARHYTVTAKIENQGYLVKLRKLEGLVDAHYRMRKYPHEYAELMHITEKHLNRISKECLNKTTRELIADRIILEAKRMLIHSKYTIAEIAAELGYDDSSYFSRFFKKNSGETPKSFLNRYK